MLTKTVPRDKRPIAHLVYPVPQRQAGRLGTALNRLKLLTPPYRRSLETIPWPSPINAPLSITKALIDTCQPHYEIRLYDILETGSIGLGADDLFIGHAWPDKRTLVKGRNQWSAYSPHQITNNTVLRQPNHKNLYLINPFNTDRGQVGWLMPLLEKVKHFIGICGDNWLENLQFEFPVFERCSFHHLNMAVNADEYPFVKTYFNAPGRRKFLYIGRVSEEKNTAMLSSLAERVGGFHCGYIADGHIAGCHKVSGYTRLEPGLLRKLASEFDFFISPSAADAQATTVLEAMAWGLGILSTKESGYSHDSIYSLSVDDIEANCDAVEYLQRCDESELLVRQQQNRELVMTKYDWATFCSRLASAVGLPPTH
jgi:glycosyltransferase involved in cell wall biosynthesis